jgi:hypothetical protein
MPSLSPTLAFVALVALLLACIPLVAADCNKDHCQWNELDKKCDVDNGNCVCQAGNWTGTDCNTPACEGAFACGAHMNCVAPKTCACKPDWKGADCKTPICNPTCGDHMTCTDAHTCVCADGWSGKECNEPTCFGKCNAHMKCVKNPEECACLEGWAGDDCSREECPTDSDGAICSKQGHCIKGACVCYSGYRGHDCSGTSSQLVIGIFEVGLGILLTLCVASVFGFFLWRMSLHTKIWELAKAARVRIMRLQAEQLQEGATGTHEEEGLMGGSDDDKAAEEMDEWNAWD